MKLLDILTPECIKAPLESVEKRAVIGELVELLHAAGKVKDSNRLRDAVWQRETTRTTGIGLGLAIPHGKCEGVPALAMAIGKPAEPIDFEAVDGRPVSLIVLLASPPDRTSDHIQALARISRLISLEDFRQKIYAAQSSEEIFAMFKAQDNG